MEREKKNNIDKRVENTRDYTFRMSEKRIPS